MKIGVKLIIAFLAVAAVGGITSRISKLSFEVFFYYTVNRNLHSVWVLFA